MSPGNVDTAIARARQAQAEVEFWSQDRVDQMVAAVGWQAYEETNARMLSELAQRETGLGDADHLFVLHRRRVLGALRDLHGVTTVGVIEELREQGLRRLAKPIGVIAAATPATAPCSGVIGDALPMLKTRNAVVFSPNPKAQRATEATVDLLRRGLAMAGAPVDLVQCLPVLGRHHTEQLMAAADLTVAVGGAGVVARAHRSGTPAVTAGVGNSTIIVDESADLAKAAAQIALGASFNHGTSCSSESNVLVAAEVAAAFQQHLALQGCHICDPDETARLRELLWPDGATLNRDAVGRAATTIAADAGIDLDPAVDTTALVAQGPVIRKSGRLDCTDPLLQEKLSPVFTLLKFTRFDRALDAVDEILSRSGQGHSCGIYTTRPDRVAQLAERARVCRVMVNQSTLGNTGSFDNGMPFTSILSCGSWGGSSESENITWRHFLNYTYISHPLPRTEPDERTIFGALRNQPSRAVV
jgi:sulfoacetaldehyde dehydrogenase